MFSIATTIFIGGLFVGSFLNVAVFRTKEHRYIVGGGSYCQNCQISLRRRDIIPVFSYAFLMGRCWNCRARISWQYPVVEFITGLIFLVIYYRYALGVFTPPDYLPNHFLAYLLRDLIISAVLIIIFVYDFRFQQILDRFTFPTIIIVLLLNLWLGVPYVSMVLGAFVFAGFFAIQYGLTQGRWVGDGDIRMGALIGVILGFQAGLVAIFIAYGIGVILGIILLSKRKSNLSTRIPLGSLLAFGTILVLLSGSYLAEWSVGLVT